MQNNLWNFIDDKGTFASETADRIKALYFPLCNTHPIMSSVSPDLHGDMKKDFNSFLLEPVSRLSLSNSKASRNFWIYVNPKKIWSATGVSKNLEQIKADKFNLTAGLLWHKITRENKKIGLRSEITSFAPSSGEPIEIMLVEITNISSKTIKFIPTSAIPVYARSAGNLHDHRHVTSLLHRVNKEKFGIIIKPTLVFDESGHNKNPNTYFVLGTNDKNQAPPEYIYQSQEEFTGDSSDLEAPDAIFKNLLPSKNNNHQGKEIIGALRFKAQTLKPKASASYIMLMGIVKDKNEINTIWKKFNDKNKVISALEETKLYWQEKSSNISLNTGNPNFDNWARWVSIQPFLRKIFGCSFLPDFDYGKGGRGWRDLWQDCLSLILNDPAQVRPLLINNFAGVRIDGSNATIIGAKPGEFIADRNNISRVWMDHGVWPLVTTHLYINQTADLNILLEKTTYFRDMQLCRGQEKDLNWSIEYGRQLKDKTGSIYKGSLLEHILVQTLAQFFNVGPHNHIRLEGADWNDGLDMAAESGESVAFSAMYTQNLATLAELILKLNIDNIPIYKELTMLLDSISLDKIDYADINTKRALLNKYFQSVRTEISGEKISLPKERIAADLKAKADWMSKHIRQNEWLKECFFNGYYDNDQKKVEGNINGLTRMTLSGQAFAIMSGIADDQQIKEAFQSARKYLKDKKLKGFRLNTDFKSQQHSLGRAFSFAYGEKENGAFFSHMCVMFAYGLYKQGFAKEGYEVLNSIYEMVLNTQKSKIYPCLPEYFNSQGRGMYSYLTGSASWFIFTLLTQAFGVRGEYGDLIIEPKLTKEQFRNKNTISITTGFAGKKIEVNFINMLKKDYGNYSIKKASFNHQPISEGITPSRLHLARGQVLSISNNNTNLIELTLG